MTESYLYRERFWRSEAVTTHRASISQASMVRVRSVGGVAPPGESADNERLTEPVGGCGGVLPEGVVAPPGLAEVGLPD